MFEHFIDAQAHIYEQAVAELKDGRKQSHWMWFIFPQMRGLGHSAISKRFAIGGLQEAARYFAHPVLGQRLRVATQAVLLHRGTHTAHEIFGMPDEMKFRSSMTLFAHAALAEPTFLQALEAFYDGVEDIETARLL